MSTSLAMPPRAPGRTLVFPAEARRTRRILVEMAHDLRSPLSSILMLAESLRGGQAGPINDVQRRQLGLIYSAALSLCSTASDVVELVQGKEQMEDDSRSPFSISEVMNSVRDMVQPMAAQRGVDLCFAVPHVVHRVGWPRAISRVLLNLATNALKHTEKGTVLIQAREIHGARPRVEFSVHDTGPGMDEPTLHSLFDAVRSNPGSKEHHFSSAGLGLSICRRLVKAMGSELIVESRVGHGTRFSFTLELPLDSAAA